MIEILESQYAYIFSMAIFVGIPFALEIFLGYREIKKFIKGMAVPLIFVLILTSILENAAFFLDAWHFDLRRNLKIVIFGDVLETYIFSVCVFSAIYIAVYIFTDYEDRGELIFPAKYAFWRKNKNKKYK